MMSVSHIRKHFSAKADNAEDQNVLNVFHPHNGHTPIMDTQNFCISPPESEYHFCSNCSQGRTNETEDVVPGGCELGAKVVIRDRYVNRVALQYYASTTYNLTSKTEEYSFARELPDG